MMGEPTYQNKSLGRLYDASFNPNEQFTNQRQEIEFTGT